MEAAPDHVAYLAEHMRRADVIECAAFGRNPTDALSHAVSSSLWALTAFVDGDPHAMMGVASLNMMEGFGSPWMLGTDRIYDHARDLVRYAPAIIGEMEETFPKLENLVSADNRRAIAFLRHVGFEFHGGPVNVGGIAFIHFRKGVT